MQNFNVLETEILDIIFRGKNKQYGAYTLRKFYPQRIRNAVGLTAALLLTAVAIYSINPAPPMGGITPFPDSTPIDQIRQIKKLILPDNPGRAGALPTAKPAGKLPIKIVDDTEILTIEIKQPVTNKPTPDIFVSVKGKGNPTAPEGMGGIDPNGKGEPTTGGGEGIKTTTAIPAPDPNMTLNVAEKMPAFPGGEDAMIRYLKTQLRYPARAINQSVEGTVYVQFVVNALGKISNVKILKGLGAGCDAEAMRVIKSMPNWSPGMQSGHAVNVEFVIPVQFEL